MGDKGSSQTNEVDSIAQVTNRLLYNGMQECNVMVSVGAQRLYNFIGEKKTFMSEIYKLKIYK